MRVEVQLSYNKAETSHTHLQTISGSPLCVASAQHYQHDRRLPVMILATIRASSMRCTLFLQGIHGFDIRRSASARLMLRVAGGAVIVSPCTAVTNEADKRIYARQDKLHFHPSRLSIRPFPNVSSFDVSLKYVFSAAQRSFEAGRSSADTPSYKGYLWRFVILILCEGGFLNICIAELSQTIVPPHNHSSQSSASSSPRIGLQRLSLSDDSASHASSSWTSSSTRPHPSFDPGHSSPPALQARTTSEPAYRSGVHPAYPAHGHPPVIMTRHIDPNALAMSGYPYAASQPMPQMSHSGSQLGPGGRSTDPSADRMSSAPGRYECNWCGKGFTRPSSLKVSGNSLAYPPL